MTGEWETLDEAAGLSFPRGAEAAITFTPGRAAWSTSQQRASSASYAAGARLVPSGANCGRQKRLEFGSFQITTSLDARIAVEEAGDELAVGGALGVGLGRVVGATVDGEHDAQPAAPGGEDHPVDRLPVDHAQLRLARLPGDGDADGADAEVSRVDERALGGRLVRPLEGVVGDADQQARPA